MKKILSSIICLAALFASCTNNEKSFQSGERTVTFSISGGNRGVTSYAPLHEADEYEISRLDIFEFDEAAKLAKIYKDVQMTQAATPESKHVQIKLDEGTKGKRTFVFIANLFETVEGELKNKMQEDLLNLAVGTTLTDFKQKQTLATTTSTTVKSNLSPKFLMTGEMTVTIPENRFGIALNYASPVAMTRNVARLDLGISLQDKNESLRIKSIRFVNLPTLTPLFQAANKYAPGNPVSVIDYPTYDATSLASHYEDEATVDYISRYKKLYYFYEMAQAQFAKSGTPTLEIIAYFKKTAQHDEVYMKYVIPFNRGIERNNLYTVVLGVKPDFNETYKPVFNINTLKWEVETTKLTIEQIIKLTLNSSVNGQVEFDSRTHVVKVLSGAAQTFETVFDVANYYEGDDNTLNIIKADPEKDAGKKITNPNNDWFTVTSTEGKLKLQVTENKTGLDRGGVIWLQSKKDPANFYKLIITQVKQ